MNKDHMYRLSDEEGLGAYFEIQKLFLEIRESIGLDDYQANRDLLYKALRAAKERDDQNQIENIATFMMVEGREGLFYEGRLSYRQQGTMADVEMKDVRYEELAEAHSIVRDEIQRATGVFIADLDIFFQQGFFYKDINEEFYALVLETFDHKIFSSEFFNDAHHRDNITALFEHGEKVNIIHEYTQNEVAARHMIYSKVIEHYI